MDRKGRYRINNTTRKDVNWWSNYLVEFNGTSIMWLQEEYTPDTLLATDSSLVGGGVCQDQFFRCSFPQWLKDNQDINITHYEILVAIEGIKLWSDRLKGHRFTIQCDNQAVVSVINTGKAKDHMLQDCLCELAFVTAKVGCWVKASYIRSKDNTLPDWLSCWDISEKAREQFKKANEKLGLKRQVIDENFAFKFSHVL